MSNSPDQATHRFRLDFPADNYEIIRSMAAENVALSMREGQEPRRSDVLMMDFEEPFLRVRSTEDIQALAERLDDFADRSEYNAQQIILDLPIGSAESLADARRAQEKPARDLARVLRVEGEWVGLIDSETLDADTWAEGFEIDP